MRFFNYKLFDETKIQSIFFTQARIVRFTCNCFSDRNKNVMFYFDDVVEAEPLIAALRQVGHYVSCNTVG